MKKIISRIVFTVLCICLVPKTGMPCSAFMLNDGGQPVYGKNTDFMHRPAFVIVNKRGVAKTSGLLGQEPYAIPISWTSQFGSVTFHMLAREWPQDGINEAGLFISTLGAEGNASDEYPKIDSRPPLSQFQMVQYQFDNFSTVDEVIASFKSIRLARPPQNSVNPMAQHWLVGDSQGNCASIEFLYGKMVLHRGRTMPAKALANSSYNHSIAYFRWYRFLKLFSPIPIPESDRPSLIRFTVAADMVKKYRPQSSGPAVDYAFQILRNVEVTPAHHTAIWAIVYDSATKQILFRSWNSDQVRWFDLSALDFSCTTPVKVLDITTDLSGDVSNSLVDYTKEIDLEMLSNWGLTQQAIDYVSSYPDTTVCTE